MTRFIILVSALAVAGCGSSPSGVRVGQAAPEISGTSVEGEVVSLSHMKGKVVVVDFWATWCGPCRQKLPELKHLLIKMDAQPFAIIGVSADHKESELKEFLDADRLPWPNIFDGDNGPINERYGIQYFPTVYVIDGKGIVRFKDVHGPKLVQVVNELLAELK